MSLPVLGRNQIEYVVNRVEVEVFAASKLEALKGL